MTATAAHFSENAETAAPVQTEADGWKNYLSQRELEQYKYLERLSQRSRELLNPENMIPSKVAYTVAGIFIAESAALFLIGTTIGGAVVAGVTPFLGLIALGTAIGAGGSIFSAVKMKKLEKIAHKRSDAIEVAKKHGVTPNTFSQ